MRWRRNCAPQVIDSLRRQSGEAVAEDEASFGETTQTVMELPKDIQLLCGGALEAKERAELK